MRSPCSHRAAKAGGLAQNSTYKCSGDPGWAIGVAFLATAVGGPVNQNRGGRELELIYYYYLVRDKQEHGMEPLLLLLC